MSASISIAKVRQVRRRLESVAPKQLKIPLLLPQPYIEYTQEVVLDPWQQDYVHHAPTESRISIAATRQGGKSMITAGFAAWCLSYLSNFVILIASRSLRQASHYLEKIIKSVTTFYPRKALPMLNKLSIALPNGSQAISIPCKNPDTARGFTPELVILDEAAFAPEPLLAVITPSLAASHGALHMISSCNGPQGFFYHACEGDHKHAYYTFKVPHTMCPRITEEFLELERATLGDVRFRSEYGAEFVSAEGAFFGFDALNSLYEGDDAEYGGLPGFKEDIPTPEELTAAKDDLSAAFDFRQRTDALLYE